MLDLARRVFKSVGGSVKSADDVNIALPPVPRQSSLFVSVKRAYQTLKVLLEAGVDAHHADHLLKLYQRFSASVSAAEAPRLPEGGDSTSSTATTKMRSVSTGSNRCGSLTILNYCVFNDLHHEAVINS